MKNTGTKDRNGIEFVDGSKVKMIEWDEPIELFVKWNPLEAKFEAQNSHGRTVTAMSRLFRNGIVVQ